jgi:hypothetical protein
MESSKFSPDRADEGTEFPGKNLPGKFFSREKPSRQIFLPGTNLPITPETFGCSYPFHFE